MNCNPVLLPVPGKNNFCPRPSTRKTVCHSRAKKEVIAIFDGIPFFRNVTPRDKKMTKEMLIF